MISNGAGLFLTDNERRAQRERDAEDERAWREREELSRKLLQPSDRGSPLGEASPPAEVKGGLLNTVKRALTITLDEACRTPPAVLVRLLDAPRASLHFQPRQDDHLRPFKLRRAREAERLRQHEESLRIPDDGEAIFTRETRNVAELESQIAQTRSGLDVATTAAARAQTDLRDAIAEVEDRAQQHEVALMREAEAFRSGSAAPVDPHAIAVAQAAAARRVNALQPVADAAQAKVAPLKVRLAELERQLTSARAQVRVAAWTVIARKLADDFSDAARQSLSMLRPEEQALAIQKFNQATRL